MTAQKTAGESKLAMLLLALCPILSMYGSLLNYAIWSFLFFILYIVIKSKKHHLVVFPLFYIYYWAYLTIDYLLLTRKIGALVPGGVSFFVFSLVLIFISKQFDLNSFRKYIRILLFVTIVIFFAQEVMWYTTGSRFVPILPLGKLSSPLSYSEMVKINMSAVRSASLFLEPAHFAVFLLLGLWIEMGASRGKRFLSISSSLIIITLLFLRSGTALAGLIVLLVYRISSYLKALSSNKRLLGFVFVGAVVAGVLSVYINTEAGAEMAERSGSELTLDEDGHSFVRLVAGTMIYNDLPLINKLFGASDETLLPIAYKYAGNSVTEDANALYMNGWAVVLTHTGIIGLVLLLIVLFHLYRHGNELSKSGIWLFVIISLFSQTYCQPIMLITMIIATFYQHQNLIIQSDDR